MTTATTIATTTLNIIKALPRWVKWSLEINGSPDGWVPLHHLDLTLEDLMVAYDANIVDIRDTSAWLIDSQVRFLEENVITIYNWLQ